MLTLNITIEASNNEYIIRSKAFDNNRPLFEDEGTIYSIVDSKELAIQLCNEAVITHNASNSPFKAIFNSPVIL